MKWPWIARSTLDATLAAWQEASSEWKRLADRQDARYADLMASYRLLRLNGATEPAPKPVPQPKDEHAVAIARTIREQSKGNTHLMKTMWTQVSLDRAKGLPDLVILDLIERRVPVDPTSDGVPA